jgi:hypothetical protein
VGHSLPQVLQRRGKETGLVSRRRAPVSRPGFDILRNVDGATRRPLPQPIVASWCNWLTRRPLKAESSGSIPDDATKQIKALQRTGLGVGYMASDIASSDHAPRGAPIRLQRSLSIRIFLRPTNRGARSTPSKIALRARMMAVSISFRCLRRASSVRSVVIAIWEKKATPLSRVRCARARRIARMGLRLKTHSRLDGVKQRAGDFAADEPAKAVNTPQRNAGIVKPSSFEDRLRGFISS